MIVERVVKVPYPGLFKYDVGHKMIIVSARNHGYKVKVYEPTFFERLFRISIEDKVKKAKNLILKEIEEDKRWDDLCRTLENS